MDEMPTHQTATNADVVAAVMSLPPRQRAVVVLRYFVDLSEADAASALSG